MDVRTAESTVPTDCEGGEAPAPRLRLTLRARLLIGALAALAPICAFTAGRASADVPAAPPTTVTVGPADTLWTVAGRVAPERDRRDVVAELVRLNALPSASLRVGQQLQVPSGVAS